MTTVLAAGIQPTTSRGSAPSLHRTSSKQQLFIDTSDTPRHSSTLTYDDLRYSNSISSSALSSPRLTSRDHSSLVSLASTPASSVFLQDPFFARDKEEEEEEDDLQFPSYDISPDEDDSSTPGNLASPVLLGDSQDEQQHRLHQQSEDDLSIKEQPSRHVDYLSHNWREEDVWSSWRHIVGRRNELENWERLENAAWRTWQKSRNNLPVVPPERLNWMKEHDVTWLYGPLQTRDKRFSNRAPVPSVSTLSRIDSFVAKKSCLKKRSLSEAMLQRSVSTGTLVQQAVDSLVSQSPSRPTRMGARRLSSRYGRQIRFNASNVSTTTPTALASPFSSGVQSPCQQRHIHFSEKVEQCIAINQDHEEADRVTYDPMEEDSEEEVLMMVSTKGKERRLGSRPTTPRSSFSGDERAKTIAMLAPTTLRGDTPEPVLYNIPSLSKSSSQETLKPPRPRVNGNRHWDDADDVDLNWQPSMSGEGETGFEDEDEEMQLKGLRRTPSGMFMPYDEDEDDDGQLSSGLLGQVINTINTAKDIAHVVWNVGWRK